MTATVDTRWATLAVRYFHDAIGQYTPEDALRGALAGFVDARDPEHVQAATREALQAAYEAVVSL